jgi:phospholipase/lecithinase/hemolysin
MKRVRLARRVLGLVLLLVANLSASRADAQTAGPFTGIVVFGDSLSDTGNFAHVTNSDFQVRYPGPSFNYTDGRFTDGADTSPAGKAHFGVWHEQLAKMFTGLTPAANSLDGGLNYAYGNATTRDGTSVVGSIGGAVSITIEDMGQQVTDYLSRPGQTVDSNALFILWGGADDLFADASAANIAGILTRITALANRLAAAGAVHILIPNLPPLGSTPGFASQPAVAAQLNAAVATYNAQLAPALNTAQATLTSNGSHTQIHQLDAGTLFADMIASPTTHGFADVTDEAPGRPVYRQCRYLSLLGRCASNDRRPFSACGQCTWRADDDDSKHYLHGVANVADDHPWRFGDGDDYRDARGRRLRHVWFCLHGAASGRLLLFCPVVADLYQRQRGADDHADHLDEGDLGHAPRTGLVAFRARRSAGVAGHAVARRGVRCRIRKAQTSFREAADLAGSIVTGGAGRAWGMRGFLRRNPQRQLCDWGNDYRYDCFGTYYSGAGAVGLLDFTFPLD